jgi:hypothetical protein
MELCSTKHSIYRGALLNSFSWISVKTRQKRQHRLKETSRTQPISCCQPSALLLCQDEVVRIKDAQVLSIPFRCSAQPVFCNEFYFINKPTISKVYMLKYVRKFSGRRICSAIKGSCGGSKCLHFGRQHAHSPWLNVPTFASE